MSAGRGTAHAIGTVIQSVTIHRVADRHSRQHERAFAETFSVDVEAGSLNDVLESLVHTIEELPCGSYSIMIDWPSDA